MAGPLPNFFIAGVPKAGTTALFNWLAAHPQMNGAYEKETCFFADPDSHAFRADFCVARGLDTYSSAFPAPTPSTRVTFEASPFYIYSRAALEHIPGLETCPKVLFILRDPADQIASVFDYFQNNFSHIPAGLTFEAFVSAVHQGNGDFKGNELARNALGYADYLPWLMAWRERVGEARMMVRTFDQLRDNPRAICKEIAGWLDVSEEFFDDFVFTKENESYRPRNRALQTLNIAVRERLPKGRVYDMARRLYRKVNTRPVDKAGKGETKAQLRAEFAARNQLVAEPFDLDLTNWGG
jgi:hypothetical protein